MKTMRNICFFAVLAIVMVGCNNSTKKNSPVKEEVKKVVDIHNAQNSLDYEGTYVGNLPTASGTGMIISLTISRNGKYEMIMTYNEHPAEPVKVTGSYVWGDKANTITLEGVEEPNSYFVGENRLFHLDIEGNRITGDLADKYILKKQ